MSRERTRCRWAASELSIPYHDQEWGVPAHDDRRLFEFLLLEGAQAGLSWETVLKKRARYREAFDQFDPERVARYGEAKIAALLADPGLIRNRLKMRAAVANACAFLTVQEEFGSFDAYIWRFTGGAPLQPNRRRPSAVPSRSRESDALSRDLVRRGFRFVGTTICYAWMQACGLVNDHWVSCFRCAELGGGKAKRRPGANRAAV